MTMRTEFAIMHYNSFDGKKYADETGKENLRLVRAGKAMSRNTFRSRQTERILLGLAVAAHVTARGYEVPVRPYL